ncbi:MAG: phosphopantetheine-binding protein [Prevotella sp.]|nr:phosphopantetheine-binding protein [Prevotella sp.]
MQNNKIEESEILAKVRDVFQQVFNGKEQKLDYGTSFEEIEDCDSISQVQVIMGIEKSFQTEFCHEEISGLKNIGDLVEMINEHIRNV